MDLLIPDTKNPADIFRQDFFVLIVNYLIT